MKRVGYIYEKICDPENVEMAIMKASLGKRDRKFVKKILDNSQYYAAQIAKMLQDRQYSHSPYSIKVVQDGPNKKERTIYKPRFYPDQVIHWSLMLQIQNLIMSGMYEYNCGSVPGRGTSYGQKTLRKWLDKDFKNTKYCLKLDLKKFYPSIDLEILKRFFRRRIKDQDCIWLIDEIIDSASPGLPIGNYTSQWFSNFYLQGLDHYIKEKLNIRYYIRYVDDLVLLGSSKKKLHKTRCLIVDYLSGIGLEMKQNWQVFLVNARPIDFLGFKFYRDKTTLRSGNSLRIRRRAKKIAGKGWINYRDACAIVSYWGWIKRSDSRSFYLKHFKPFVDITIAKKRIAQNARS